MTVQVAFKSMQECKTTDSTTVPYLKCNWHHNLLKCGYIFCVTHAPLQQTRHSIFPKQMTSQVRAYFRPRNVDVEARAGVLTDERVIGVRLARIKRASIEAMQGDVQDTTTDNI